MNHANALGGTPGCEVFAKRFGGDREDCIQVETLKEGNVFGKWVGASVERGLVFYGRETEGRGVCSEGSALFRHYLFVGRHSTG